MVAAIYFNGWRNTFMARRPAVALWVSLQTIFIGGAYSQVSKPDLRPALLAEVRENDASFTR